MHTRTEYPPGNPAQAHGRNTVAANLAVAAPTETGFINSVAGTTLRQSTS